MNRLVYVFGALAAAAGAAALGMQASGLAAWVLASLALLLLWLAASPSFAGKDTARSAGAKRLVVRLGKFAAVAVLVIGLGPYACVRSCIPLTYAEADLDHDGRVSLTEASFLTDSGRRPIVVNGVSCTEYFFFKDGMPIKTICPPIGK